jgi:UDP-MurNAc hydroxylase
MVSARKLCDNIGGAILLNITGKVKEKIIIDFTGKLDKNSIIYYNKDDYFYEFKLEGKWLNQILEKKITWEEFFLSLRFRVKRNPDEYSEHLMAFLKLADPVAHKKYEKFHFSDIDKEETFILDFENRQYKCQRYCPHANGDLSRGEIINDVLVCPTHNWKFKLPSGKSITSTADLKIEGV